MRRLVPSHQVLICLWIFCAAIILVTTVRSTVTHGQLQRRYLENHVVNSTMPPTPRQCELCMGSNTACKIIHHPVTCPIEQQYCINKVSNEADGSQRVERRCGTYQECVNGWWKTYSSIDKCTRFKEDAVYTLSFTCEFCCTTDNCNANLNPVDKFVQI